MRKIGISVYPEITGKEKTKKYIELAEKYGFNRIFMNLLEVEKGDDTKIKTVSDIAKFATSKGFEVIVDVNPAVYKSLNLPKNEIDFFADLGFSGIRLDEDFGGELECELSNNKRNLLIELNASSGTGTFDKVIKLGGNPKQLIACHNFYPMRLTGLSRDRFIELSSHYHALGIRVAAFLTLPKGQKDTFGPWNINDGMPTIEENRFINLKEQVIDYLSYGTVTDFIISSQGATEEQFKEIKDVITEFEKMKKESSVSINVKLNEYIADVEKEIILKNKGFEHTNRPDYTSYFVRSTMPRIRYKNNEIKPSNSGKEIKPGDLLILNENLGRYKGEFHIALKNFKDEENGRNIVGRLCEEDFYKLKFLKDGKKFTINNR